MDKDVSPRSGHPDPHDFARQLRRLHQRRAGDPAVQRFIADAQHAGVLCLVAVRRRVALEVVMQVAATCHAQTTSKRAIIAWSSCSMLWQ